MCSKGCAARVVQQGYAVRGVQQGVCNKGYSKGYAARDAQQGVCSGSHVSVREKRPFVTTVQNVKTSKIVSLIVISNDLRPKL